MRDLTLVSELFPRGIVLRIRRGQQARFGIYWQWQHRPFSIEGDVLLDVIRDALQAVAAQQDGMV